MIEPRTIYGYPVMPDKLLQAQRYAAEARARNTPPCDCPACRQQAMLPAVMNIIAARTQQ
jgi:hypothetical protein